MNAKFLAVILFTVFISACQEAAPVAEPEAPPTAPEPVAEVDQITGPNREKKFTSVTDEYGPLVVRETQGPELDAADSGFVPWSAYWYPRRRTEMFEGDNSPLAKYDRFLKATGRPTGAVQHERDNFDEMAGPAEGLCHAWALAAIHEAPVTRPKQVAGITFSVADQKALLLKTYENPGDLKVFGEKNTGLEDANHYPDIYPDQFHKFLQVELFQKKRPFVMDHDAGPEVWNFPFYKAELRLTRDPQDPHVMHVQAWVYGAKYSETPSDALTLRPFLKRYMYDLVGNPQPDGSLQVVYGIWTKEGVVNSRQDHPDYLIPMPDTPPRKSYNPFVRNEYVDMIRRGEAR